MDEFTQKKNRVYLDWKKREWVYAQWCRGYTQEEIAGALDVCTKTIQRALKGRERIKPILEYKE